MNRAGGAALFVVVTSAAVFSLADDKPTARLSWVRLPGAESCVDDAALRASVVARLGRDPFAATPMLAIEGTIAREPKRWIAKLWVRDEKGAPLGNRELTSEADSCASLGDAVALAIALAIDPDAATAPVVASASASASALPLAASVSSRSMAKPRPAPAASSSSPSPDRGVTPAASPLIAVRGVLASSLLPKPAPGVAFHFEPIFAPHIRPTFGAMYLPPQKTARGDASIAMTTGYAGACAQTTGSLRFGVDGCVHLHAGATHAATLLGEPDAPGDRFWLGVSPGIRFRLRALPFVVEVPLELMVPLTRHRFFKRPVVPDTPIFSQGSLGFLVGLGIGWLP